MMNKVKLGLSALARALTACYCAVICLTYATAQINASIEDLFTLPEDEIDMGKACLILAKEAYPNLEIEAFDKLIDYMASRLEVLMQGNTSPETRIRMINTYLYQPGWWNDSLTFNYDLEDLPASKKDNQFLNGYLATRQGSCITMPMLYVVLGDRLGWPINAVRSPKHFFVRYVEEGFDQANIETTNGGGFISDEMYKNDAEIPDRAIANGVYLRTLTKREYLASLLVNNSRHSLERECNIRQAISILRLAVATDSTLASAYWNLGKLYDSLALQYQQISELTLSYSVQSPANTSMELGSASARLALQEEALDRSEYCRRKAERLGIVLTLPEVFFLKQAGNVEDSW